MLCHAFMTFILCTTLGLHVCSLLVEETLLFFLRLSETKKSQVSHGSSILFSVCLPAFPAPVISNSKAQKTDSVHLKFNM